MILIFTKMNLVTIYSDSEVLLHLFLFLELNVYKTLAIANTAYKWGKFKNIDLNDLSKIFSAKQHP